MGTQQHALSLSHLPEPLHGVGSMVSNAFRDGSMGYSAAARAGSMPAFQQLQGDLLSAADNITSNMSNLVQELDQGKLRCGYCDCWLSPLKYSTLQC